MIINAKTRAITNTKPYTIAMVGENDAEISMYGEVVEERPIDYWTGEPIPGNFIALDDFLKDLDELGAKDNITVHINSVGGSLYAGLAIYNRLKALAANIITVNDSLAASAASIIFQAGNTRKVNAGSNLMIHEAAGFLFGYFQIADLKSAIKQLDAHNKTAVAAYAEATGRDADAISAMMAKETWMTGQEAVDAGFADEVITDSKISASMSLTPDKKFIISNGIAMSTRGMSTMPTSAAIMTSEQLEEFKRSVPESVSPENQADINKNIAGGYKMEIKNLDELKAAFPELVAQAENAASAEGMAAERARIQGIEDIEAAIGDKAMVKNAKYGEQPLTAEQLAFAAMRAQAAIGATVVSNLAADTAASNASEVTGAPAPLTELEKEQEEEKAAINFMSSFRPKKEVK